MTEKNIYTGLYVLGEMSSGTSCGGISGKIGLPDYKKEILFFLNDTHKHKSESIHGSSAYCFNIEEMESMHKAIERLLNDLRKLESLSKKDLLRDEAYSS